MKWRRKRRARYTSKPDPGRTAVYQFRDKETQDHVYVGTTNNPGRRFREHAGLSRDEKKWWWDQADHAYVAITWYSTRKEARAVETRLIRQLRPPGNKIDNPDWEATTTWRPPKAPIFRGSAKPAMVAALAWSFPTGAVMGVQAMPPALIIGGLIVGVIYTRVAWKRIQR